MGRSRATRPTLQQKKWIHAAGLDPRDWLALLDQWGSLKLVHRSTGQSRIIEK